MAFLNEDAAAPADVAALVGRARARDERAFDALYHRFARYVHALVLCHHGPDEAMDVVQEVFLTAFRDLHCLKDAAAFPGWLATIARNRAHDARESACRRTTRTAPLRVAEPAVAREASPEQQAEARRILAEIRRLPEAYRETLVLHLVDGMTGPEIAAVTNLTPDSVRVNLHRGLRQLRARLGMSK